MAQDFLKPTKVPHIQNLERRLMEDGQFRNPPLYTEFGGLSSSKAAKMGQNKMTLEKGGPSALRGRPISK